MRLINREEGVVRGVVDRGCGARGLGIGVWGCGRSQVTVSMLPLTVVTWMLTSCLSGCNETDAVVTWMLTSCFSGHNKMDAVLT